MVQTEMLAPAATLVVWTLIVLVWLLVSRLRALKQAGIEVKDLPPGNRGVNFEGKLPDKVMWKSHNYSHLTEQPTLFYATAIILSLAGASRLDIGLAWAYVVLRIVHSLWQGNVNVITIRGPIFAAATLCLAVLAIRALLGTLGVSA